MITRSQIQRYARSLIGTPFVHQGRVVGPRGGIDCIGVLLMVAQHIGRPIKDRPGYPRRPDGSLEKVLASELDRLGCCCNYPPQVGDVLCFAGSKIPQHVAIRTDKGMVHALGDSKVVNETSLDRRWRERLVSVWGFRVKLESDVPALALPELYSPKPARHGCRCGGKDSPVG